MIRGVDVFTQVRELIRSGHLDQAMRIAQVLAHDLPADPRPWSLMAEVAELGGNSEGAISCLKQAIARAPNEATYGLRYGQCLARAGQRREALDVAAKLSVVAESNAAWLDALGTLYTYCDEPAQAQPFFCRAAELAPQNSHYLYNLSTTQRMLGQFEEAESSLNRAIAENPHDYGAYYMRSGLRAQTSAQNHVLQLTRMLELPDLKPMARIPLHFAVAKELEDLGQYASSFSHLQRGCTMQRQAMTYDVAQDIDTIDRLIDAHDAGAISGAPPGFDSEECIIVMGLPRTGTTLVESILGAHPQIYAAGELNLFQHLVVRAVQQTECRPIDKRELISRSLEVDPCQLGRSYIEATRPRTGQQPRFVDKTPLNYLYAALIRRALPKTRFIALMRDPMDSCYAMYKTLFAGAYPFSYDLGELGLYYRAWGRLLNHWRATLGEALLVVEYENLVSNQEAVTRRVIDHCGLPWDSACLRFHERKEAVTTASAVQVRQRIYASSVGRWRHYAEELRELSRILIGTT